MKLTLVLLPNGNFNIIANESVVLTDCYPYINGRPLHIIRLEQIGADKLCYHTAEGSVILSVHTFDDCNLAVQITFNQLTIPIHTFSVFGNPVCSSLVGAYKAAGRKGEDCGYFDFDKLRKTEDIASHGLTVLRLADGYLTIFVKEHTRYEYSHRYHYEPQGKHFCLTTDFRLENIYAPNECLPTVYLMLTDTLNQGLNMAAERIGTTMKARLQQPPAYHWCSWYYYYSDLDQRQLAENLRGLPEADPLHKLRYIQIDAGYSSAVGDWLSPHHRFDQGMKAACDQIIGAGYVPGIWVGVFMAGNRSRLALDHPQWLLKDLSGKTIRTIITDNEPKLWGYQDEEYYILDTSHPEALSYVREVFRTFRQWGVQFFKTDFMLWGYQDSTEVQRHTPGKTSVEYFRDVLNVIREEIGEESYLLGCIAPFLPFIGYADGMRVGYDVGSTWDGQFGPQNMIRSVIGNFFTNHRYYQNDPDAIILRDFFVRLTDTEIKSLAFYAALSGGCVYTSDPLHLLTEDRLRFFDFLEPRQKVNPEFPYIETARSELVLVHRIDQGCGGLIFIFNVSEKEVFEEYSLTAMGFAENRYLLDSKHQGSATLCSDLFTVRTKPHDYHLFVVSEDPNCTFDTSNLWNNLLYGRTEP